MKKIDITICVKSNFISRIKMISFLNRKYNGKYKIANTAYYYNKYDGDFVDFGNYIKISNKNFIHIKCDEKNINRYFIVISYVVNNYKGWIKTYNNKSVYLNFNKGKINKI